MSPSMRWISIIGGILCVAALVFAFQMKENAGSYSVQYQTLDKLKELGQVEEVSFEEWIKNHPNEGKRFQEWKKQQEQGDQVSKKKDAEAKPQSQEEKAIDPVVPSEKAMDLTNK
jgi:hypothetical protein